MTPPSTPQEPVQPLSHEQIEWIVEQTENTARKSAREAARSVARRATIGFVILLAGLAVALVKLERTTATVHDLQRVSTRACERLNIVRAQSNTSDSVSFNILSNSGRRELALAKADEPNTIVHRQSGAFLLAQAERLTVTELTDCRAAQKPGYDYPLAHRIGNPQTGKIDAGSKVVLAHSATAVQQSKDGQSAGQGSN